MTKISPFTLIQLIYLYVGLLASIGVTAWGTLHLAQTAIRAASGSYTVPSFPSFPLSVKPDGANSSTPLPEQQAQYEQKIKEIDEANARNNMINDFASGGSFLLVGIVLMYGFQRSLKKFEQA